MSLENDNNKKNPESRTEFVDVKFIVDQETNWLKAELSLTSKDPNLNLVTLEKLLKENQFKPFKVSHPVLLEILRRSQKKEIGTINVAEKPTYYDIQFEYDAETRTLYANLIQTEKELNFNMMFIQDKIRENKLDKYALNFQALQNLINYSKNKKPGKYEIGKKPEFTKVQFSFNPEKKMLIASLVLSEEEFNLSIETLQEYLKKNKFDQFYYKKNVLEDLLKRIERNERGQFEVAERKDAQISVSISSDEMSAKITTQPPCGGKELTRDLLEIAIAKFGIEKKTCNQKVLDKIVEKKVVKDIVFARGIYPKDGQDADFEPLIESTIEHAPRKDDTGKVDFYHVKDYTNVKPGDPVLRRVPATTGSNGCDVLGRVVPAKIGVEKTFSEKCKGVQVDENDPDLLIATERGYPVIFENGARVEDILLLNDVDLHSGNISYDGSVLITGVISPGMVVHVTGDVIVTDTVNNATLIAGNNIIINGGVMGSDVKELEEKEEEIKTEADQFQAHLSAGGSIKANFISRADIQAQGNIDVKEYIAHSFAFSNKKILVGQRGGKGQILGGKITAKRGVVVNSIGASAAVRTKVMVGYTPTAKREYKKYLKTKEEKNKELKQLLYCLEKNPDILQNEDEIKEYNDKLLALIDQIAYLSNRSYDCRLDIVKSNQNGIEVKENVYPNVVLDINNAKLLIELEMPGAGKYVYFNGEIKLQVNSP